MSHKPVFLETPKPVGCLLQSQGLPYTQRKMESNGKSGEMEERKKGGTRQGQKEGRKENKLLTYTIFHQHLCMLTMQPLRLRNSLMIYSLEELRTPVDKIYACFQLL